MAKVLSTRNLATVIDDFGAAATASNPSLTAQAQTALSDYARFSAKAALPIGIAIASGQAALQAFDSDWEGAAKTIVGFTLGATAAKLGQGMMAGYATALADGFIGPASGASLSCYGSKFVQGGGSMLLAGATVFAFNKAWDLTKEIHSGTIVSDYAWFLGKVEEYAEGFIDDAFDGNVNPADIGGALNGFMDLWGDAVPITPPEDPGDWIPGVSTPFAQGESTASPLVLDIAGTGINLAALGGSGSVYWNFDGGDFANASGWIATGSGLLAIDANDDGTINDHSELFGTETTDGFTVLSAYDSNTDDVIDLNDSAWSDLLVWLDTNSDGYSQATELHTLDALDITSINLNASLVSYDIAGNPITNESTFVIDGQTHDIVDAWFAYDTVNTVYRADYNLDVRALFLPTLRGYGDLPDLHISMSQDATLLSLVQDVATMTAADMLDPSYDFQGKVQDIMFRWAEVDQVDPSRRGEYMDARYLECLEAFMGQGWVQLSSSSDPLGPGPVDLLMEAWENAHSAIAHRLIVQGAGRDLFTQPPQYDPVSDTINVQGSFDVSALGALSSTIDHTDIIESSRFWLNTFALIDNTIGLDNLTTTEKADIENIMLLDDPYNKLSFDYVADSFVHSSDSIYGDANDNLQFAIAPTSSLNGADGDDLLFGGLGTDSLFGNAGADILVDGGGINVLYGGGGDDLYVVSIGGAVSRGPNYYYYSRVEELTNEGVDTVLFADDIDTADVFTWTDSTGNLYLEYSEDDLLIVTGSHVNQASVVGDYLERIEFADSTVWDLTAGLHLRNNDTTRTLYGSNLADNIQAGAGDDDLYGKGGNDTLAAGSGLNIMYGGLGDDTYEFGLGDAVPVTSSYWNHTRIEEVANEGTDTLLFAAGIDPADVFAWTDASGNLYVEYSEEDRLIVKGGDVNRASVVAGYLERIEFADSTVWDLTAGLHLRNNDTGRTFYGSDFGDTLEAGTGYDTLHGKGGNDTLAAGSGLNIMYGGLGDDTYEFGLGDAVPLSTSYWDHTRIQEIASEGSDTLLFAAGINPADVFTWTDASGNLYIEYSEDDQLIVSGSHVNQVSVVADRLERIEFADSTDNHTSRTFYGSNQGDTLEAGANGDTVYAKGGDDVLIGGADNDNLRGEDGNDSLYGGDGLDHLYGGNGADRFALEAATAFNDVDQIEDFSIADDDVIDITDVLDGFYDPLTDVLTNFVDITTNGSNSELRVDTSGQASFGAGTLERFTLCLNREGFPSGHFCDSRCWLERRPASDDPTSFQ